MKTADMAVTLIDHMGSDLTVVNAARVSFDKESKWEFDTKNYYGHPSDDYRLSEQDAKLIRYLAKHNHWTPFGHCFAQFRIKAPIFVARQLVKHQVGLVWNEVSRRYVDSEPEFWFPEVWRGRPVNAKQGSTGLMSNPNYWDASARKGVQALIQLYSEMIEEGVAPEQARMILPQNMMTEWYWSGSLAAFARVCKLRLDPHAQEETRVIAEGIAGDMSRLFPVSWKELMG